MKKWIGHIFESSSGLTPEFAAFARDFKREFKKGVRADFDIIDICRGHFYLFGFVKNKITGRFVYFSISDVRFFPGDWYHNILVRTAEHEKDYTGDRNHYTAWKNLLGAFVSLSK